MTVSDLDLVFGPGDGTPEARAARSRTQYVRSQVQLALFREGAKGRVLSAAEALNAFGLNALVSVHQEGSFSLIWQSGEPAKTLSSRRKDMKISVEKLASATGLTKVSIEEAEKPNRVVPIRQLEVIAQHLALDERLIGFSPQAGSDQALAVRLRQLQEQRDEVRFTESSVLRLAEAGWVIARQASLCEFLNQPSFRPFSKPDGNLSYPAWKHGFRLAAETRRHLELMPTEPIKSLRDLFERELSIPFVQQDLGEKFAGATIANGNVRGIVVNERGANSNVWVRRMTMCHELGHLLWDPDQHLNKLTVDSYDEILGLNANRTDPVEIRANAFAVAFLAPPEAVKAVFSEDGSDTDHLFNLAERYGISLTAARYHAQNVLNKDFGSIIADYPTPSDEWQAAENRAVDYFPITTTPITRRGRFAYLAARGFKLGLLSADSAASLLRTDARTLLEKADAIVELTA